MEAIFKRKSIRNYTDEPVSEADLHDLLHAGMSAPTANHARPWHFIVVTDHETLQNLPADPYMQPIKNAQVAIVICGDTTKDTTGGQLNAFDCSAAAENILIEVADKGLGSVWLAVNPIEHREKHVRELLGLPENIVPYVVLPIGWPRNPVEEQDRFDATMVHENRW